MDEQRDAWAAIESARARRRSPTCSRAEPDRLSRLALDAAGHPFRFLQDPSRRRRWSPPSSALAEAQRSRRRARRPVRRARSSIRPRAAPPSIAPSAARARRRASPAPRGLHARMRALIDAIEAGRSAPVRHILHIGIGGSALGPELADRRARPRRRPLRGRGRLQRRRRRARGSGRRLRSRTRPWSSSRRRPSPPPRRCSTRARRSTGWSEGGVADPYGRVIALTAAPERGDRVRASTRPASCRSPRASAGAIRSGRRSAFRPRSRSAGTRFEELLEGAAEMDRHFRLAPLARRTRRCSPPSPTAITPMSAAAETRARLRL